MNNPTTLRDKLHVLVSTERPPRDARELLDAELREKNAVGVRSLAFFDALSLDFALFFHKFFAAWVVTALLLAVVGGWIAIVSLMPPPAAVSSKMVATTIPGNQTSTVTSRATAARVLPQSVAKIDAPIAALNILAEPVAPRAEEHEFATLEPLDPAHAMPNPTSMPSSIRQGRLRFPDPPLDYSGFVASVSYEQSSIPADPAHPEFGATSTSDLNYQAGYRFDRYQEAGIGYSRHIYRHVGSPTYKTAILNNGISITEEIPGQDSDDPVSLPGIYYTFHANDLEILGVEPFATVFASKPSVGFLWRASAGVEWNPWDNVNAVIAYSREQLNSATYAAPQNTHNFFDFGFSYRLLP